MKAFLLITLLCTSMSAFAQTDTLSLDGETEMDTVVVADKDNYDLDTTRADIGTVKPIEIDDSDITYTASLSGNYASGTVNRFLINTAHHVNFTASNFAIPIVATFSYGKQNDELKEREFAYVATPTYKLGKVKFYNNIEYEKSNVRGITSRLMLGGGAGYTFYSKDDNDISLSNFILHEETLYFNEMRRDLFRNSTRLRVKLRYNKVSITSLTYYQPSYADINNYRVNNNSTVSVKLSNKLAFATTYQYNFESLVVVTGKKKANTFVTVGLSFSHK